MSVLNSPLGDDKEFISFPTPYADIQAGAMEVLSRSADLLGTTWQQMAQEMATLYGKCANTADECFKNVQNELVSKYQDNAEAWKAVTNTLAEDLKGHVATLISSMQCGDYECIDQDVPKPTCPLFFGEYYAVENTVPSGFKNPWESNFPGTQWAQNLPKYYYLDNVGNPIGGGQINCDWSIAVGSTKYEVCSVIDSGYNDPINPPWGQLRELEDPKCIVPGNTVPPAAILNCDCSSKGLIGPPLEGPGNPLIPPPPPDNPPPPPPGKCPPCPPPETTMIGGQCCPPQTIVVPAPIVNVNVLPSPPVVCPPGSGTNPPPPVNITVPAPEVIIEPIQESPADVPEIPPWEPPDTDFVKEVLNTMGFPEDFVNLYGDVLDAEELLEDEPLTASKAV